MYLYVQPLYVLCVPQLLIFYIESRYLEKKDYYLILEMLIQK